MDSLNGNGKATLKDVLDRVDSAKTELREEIGRNRSSIDNLADQFNNLEAGRLSAAEKDIAQIKAFGTAGLILLGIIQVVIQIIWR